MKYTVSVSAAVDAYVSAHFGGERSADGRPSVCDFESGPLAAARTEFSYFDDLPESLGPPIRFVVNVDVFFGALTFTGVLVEKGSREDRGSRNRSGLLGHVRPRRLIVVPKLDRRCGLRFAKLTSCR